MNGEKGEVIHRRGVGAIRLIHTMGYCRTIGEVAVWGVDIMLIKFGCRIILDISRCTKGPITDDRCCCCCAKIISILHFRLTLFIIPSYIALTLHWNVWNSYIAGRYLYHEHYGDSVMEWTMSYFFWVVSSIYSCGNHYTLERATNQKTYLLHTYPSILHLVCARIIFYYRVNILWGWWTVNYFWLD